MVDLNRRRCDCAPGCSKQSHFGQLGCSHFAPSAPRLAETGLLAAAIREVTVPLGAAAPAQARGGGRCHRGRSTAACCCTTGHDDYAVHDIDLTLCCWMGAIYLVGTNYQGAGCSPSNPA